MHSERDDLQSRRSFLQKAGIVALAGVLPRSYSAEAGSRYRAVIIGHTGQGNYGHELDLLFTDHPRVELLAMADADETGRSKAVARSGAKRQYADYRVMLEREKPDLVCVAPRATVEHAAMIAAALESNAHVYCEKPITQTLAEADALLESAEKKKRRIAVSHQIRLAPGILYLKGALERGIIGDLVEVRAYGKQDSRAGGEDMLVLGVHLFDLMRFFAGDAVWCFAQVKSKGHDITRTDAREATEAIGPVAGDDIHAQFGFSSGVHGSFTSTARLRQTIGQWGLELVGSAGTIRILADVFPRILMLKPSSWTDRGRSDQWTPIEGDPTMNATAAERAFGPANRRVLADWLGAIEQGREPVCSGRAAAKALEMVMAVYQSALARSRVEMPLKERSHPLGLG
jgi:predicted dehydrogenase